MKYILGGIIVIVFLGWGTVAFLETTIQYVSIDEARTATRTVQVMGKIDFNTVNYDTEQSLLLFSIYDAEATDEVSAAKLPVQYAGTVPGNFDQATSVVLKGKPVGETFVVDQMLVKCPSKYQGETGKEYQDPQIHADSTASQGV